MAERLTGPVPVAPGWAVDQGLPAPDPGESFRAYAARLGLDAEALLDGLDERTAVVANMRLATAVRRRCPRAWNRYSEERWQGSR